MAREQQGGWLVWVVGIIVLAIAGGFWYWTKNGGGETPRPPVVTQPSGGVSPQAPSAPPAPPAPAPSPTPSPAPVVAPAPTPVPVPPGSPRVNMPEESPAHQEAEAIALNLRSFGQRFGGNPTGTNAEIVRALTGGNPAGATYLPTELRKLNSDGELLDYWGTPYFFHSDSATSTEVRSAGPDKVMWTPDDVISR